MQDTGREKKNEEFRAPAGFREKGAQPSLDSFPPAYSGYFAVPRRRTLRRMDEINHALLR